MVSGNQCYVSSLCFLPLGIYITLYSLYEVPSRDHWWDDVLSNDKVQAFLDDNIDPRSPSTEAVLPRSFVLTVTTPEECGSLYGWRIRTVTIPGRLARLIIDIINGTAVVKTTNVWSFSVDTSVSPIGAITVDGGDTIVAQGAEKDWRVSKQKGHWEVS